MKTFIFAMMLAAPLWASHALPGCKPTQVSVPYVCLKKKPIYTPSVVPKPERLDIDVPIVRRCPSIGGGFPSYGVGPGGVKVEKNKNVFQGQMYGSKANMSAGGTGNVNSNAKKNIKVRVKGGRKRRGGRKGHRGHGKKCLGGPAYGYPIGPRYGGIDVQNNKNVFAGHVSGSKLNMSAGGSHNVNSNSEEDLDLQLYGAAPWGGHAKRRRGKGCGCGKAYGMPHYYSPHYGRPAFGGIKKEDNKNVFAGVVSGSDLNMSAGGSGNVNANQKVDKKIKIKGKRRRKGRKGRKCRKGRKNVFIGSSKD